MYSKFRDLIIFCAIGLLAISVAGLRGEVSPLRGGLDHELLDDSAYPLAPVALVDNRLYEVVSGSEGRAIVALDGMEELVPESSSLRLAKGQQFADGMVEVLKSSVMPSEGKASRAGWGSGFRRAGPEPGTEVSLRFRSSLDYEDVTLCVLLFNDLGERAIQVQALGDVQSGMEHEETFVFPEAYDYENDSIRYAFLFFCGDGEIVTNGREAMTPFLDRLFREFYLELVYGYMQAKGSGDAPVQLAHRYPVFVKPALLDKSSLEALHFSLEVDERGFVSRIDPEEPTDAEVLLACRRSLQEWLFLPKLESGLPVRSRVRVPIELR